MELWRQYEEEIYDMLAAKAAPDAEVRFDVKLPAT
jgi:hypothetical protein